MPEEVLVVGDPVADVMFAKNIGAMACWARYGHGDKSEPEKLSPKFVINSLEDVEVLVERAVEQGGESR